MAIGDILAGFAQAGHEHQTNLIEMAYKQRDTLANAYSRLMQDDSYPEEARQQFGQAFQDITTSDPFKLPQTIKKYQDMKISVSPPKALRQAKAGPEVDQNLSLPPGSSTAPLGREFPNIPPPQPPQGMMEEYQPASEMRSLMSPIPFGDALNRSRQQERMKFEASTEPLEKLKQGEWKPRSTYVTYDEKTGEARQMQRMFRINPNSGEQEEVDVPAENTSRGFAVRQQRPITIDQAIALQGTGEKFLKAGTREPMDLAALKVAVPDLMIVGTGNPNEYEYAAQSYGTASINNQVTPTPKIGPLNPSTVGAPLGTAVPPKTTERPMQITTAEGGRGIVTPTATTTVQTGPTGAPAPPTAGALPTAAPLTVAGTGVPAPPQAPPVKAPVPPSPLVSTTTTPPPTRKNSGLTVQNIQGSMNPGEYNRQAKIVTSIKPALNTILGDPENPSFKGLDSFATLVDDEASRARVGNAARIIIHEIGDTGSGGSGIGAQIFGTGINLGGGLITALENKLGVTEWKASTSGAVIDKAMNSLSPDERMFLDRLIGAYGTVVGLRAVTSGSALQFNTKLMEKELPVPGLSGVVTRRQFYDKLATLVGEPLSSTKTFSPTVFTDRDYYMRATRRFTALGNGETVVKGTGGKPDLVLRNGAWVPLQ